jgi:beta-glucosidase
MTDLFNDAIVTGVVDMDADGTPDKEIPGLKGTTDYWGVNYYGIIPMDSGFPLPYVGGIPEMDATQLPYKMPVNDLRWGIYPEGFRERLNYYWKKWGNVDGKLRPLIVTENGVADAQDLIRPKFLVDHLRQLLLAVEVDGVDIRGYYHWTLVDNFEWAEGYAAWFGLYQLDPHTQVRTETEGARAYRAIAEAKGITKEIQEKWGAGEYAAAQLLEQNYFAPPQVDAR